jgi:4Fe-4S ferredoxin
VCPLDLITFAKTTYDGTPVTDFDALSPSQKKHVQINLEIKKEYCPTCRVCELKCAPGVIKVRKSIEGRIAIDQSKCPEGCTDCLDVCPIKGALFFSETDKKVHANDAFCDYCGACKIVCPVADALTVSRTKILHTPIESGTWNKVLLRLTSPSASVQELKAKAAQKRKDLVARRFVFEGAVR